jgi:TP901 family phage tail tape measure protein
MAKKIKGIVVQLGGDTSGLTKALADADKALSTTQKEINEVQKALKLDPSNTVLLAQKQELLTKAISDTSAKLRTLEDNAEKAKKAFEANGEWERQFTPLKEKIDAAKKSLGELKDKQQEAKKQFEAGNISSEDYEKINADVKAAEKALADLNAEKKKLNEQFKDGHITAEEYREYQREVERTRGQLQNLQTELRNTSAVSEEQRQKITQFGEHAKETFKNVVKAAAAITAALLAVGKQAVETGAEFDKSMSQVAATLGYTWEELTDGSSDAAETMQALRDFALDLGKSTAFSAKEASEGLQYMALAGMDAAASMEMLPKVLDLASASGMELGKSSDMVTDAMSALGLSADGTTVMIDQMAKTASRSNTSVEQLGAAILTIGATGKDVAGGTKELSQALGLLADNGVKGAEGGTKLRNIILALEAPTDKAAMTLEKLGVKAFDANGEFRPLQDTFFDLKNALANMTEQDAAIAKSKIFSKRDLAAVNALLNTSVDRWNQLADEIEDSAGAAHDMAEVQLDNLAGDVTLFKSALEGAEITISDRLTPSLRNAVQFGTEAVTKLANGFGEGGLSGAVAAAHKLIRDSFGEDAKLIYGTEAAVQSLIAAFVTYKATMLLSEGIAALKTVNLLLKEGKTLTEALNAAQMANPYVLIATVAIAAGAAVKKLIDVQTDLIDETIDVYSSMTDEQKRVMDSTKALSQQVNDSRESWGKEQETIEKQAATYRGLADELYKLDSQQQISVKDRAAMKAIADKLNTSIKGLNIQLDAETGHLLTQRQVINDIIDGYERRAKAAAAEERLTKLYEQQINAELSRKDALKQVEEAENELNHRLKARLDVQNEIDDYINSADFGTYTQKWADLTAKLDEANQAVKEQENTLGDLRGAYANTGQSLSDVNDDIDTTKNLIGELAAETEADADTTAESFDKMGAAADKMSEQTGISLQELSKQVDKKTTEIENRIKEYEDKLKSRTGTLQSWFAVDATVSGDEAKFETLKKALDKQIADMDKWQKGIATLEEKGINQNFLDRLKDAGPQSQALVTELLKVPDKERNEYTRKWNEAYEGAASVAEQQLARMKRETENSISVMIEELKTMSPEFASAWKDLGGDAIDGYIDGLRDGEKLKELKKAVKAMVDAALEETAEEQESASPSKKAKKLGGDFGDGYTGGIEDKISGAVSAAKKMVSGAINAADTAGGIVPGIGAKIAGAAKSVSTSVAAAQTVQAVPAATIDYDKIGAAVREALSELASGDFVAATIIDGDVIATKTYRKIDALIGDSADLMGRGYAT